MEPQIHQKSVKVGDPHWGIAFFEAKVTPKIDFERSQVDFKSRGCILEPFWTHFGEKTFRNPTKIHPHTIWPGGMRGAIEYMY